MDFKKPIVHIPLSIITVSSQELFTHSTQVSETHTLLAQPRPAGGAQGCIDGQLPVAIRARGDILAEQSTIFIVWNEEIVC